MPSSAARIVRKPGKARLKRAIDLTREVLQVPADYRIGIVPASDTGAIEMALWSLLGPQPVTMLAWESFGEGWVGDVAQGTEAQGRDGTARRLRRTARSQAIDPASDIVFTWNGTTSGVRVPNADWIAADRDGLTICDATSAAFAQPLDWPKLDVVTFSWQKALGGEAAHGMLDPVAPRGRAARELYAAVADAENLPHDQGRQTHRRDLRGRDHQHAVDAVRRGLSRRAANGRSRSAGSRR